MTPDELRADKDFMAASPAEQHQYLVDSDADYARAPQAERQAYLNHVRGDNQAPQTSPSVLGILWKNLKETPESLYQDAKSTVNAVMDRNWRRAPETSLSTVLPLVAGGPGSGGGTRLGALAVGKMLDNPSTS